MHHNLISYNSMRPWLNVEKETSYGDSIDDYFECISECDTRDKTCISQCRVLLDRRKPSVMRVHVPYFLSVCYN